MLYLFLLQSLVPHSHPYKDSPLSFPLYNKAMSLSDKQTKILRGKDARTEGDLGDADVPHVALSHRVSCEQSSVSQKNCPLPPPWAFVPLKLWYSGRGYSRCLFVIDYHYVHSLWGLTSCQYNLVRADVGDLSQAEPPTPCRRDASWHQFANVQMGIHW